MSGATDDRGSICVYCGSKSGTYGKYVRIAESLGQAIARAGMRLVYGGGNVGLMGSLAEAVMADGGGVTGVIPRALRDRELAHSDVDELIVVDDMHERKALMAARADAFVALPGGYGTLEELFEAVAWAQLGIHQKPVSLLNSHGFFDHLIAFLDHANAEEFLKPQHRSLLHVESDPDKLVSGLARYVRESKE